MPTYCCHDAGSEDSALCLTCPALQCHCCSSRCIACGQSPAHPCLPLHSKAWPPSPSPLTGFCVSPTTSSTPSAAGSSRQALLPFCCGLTSSSISTWLPICCCWVPSTSLSLLVHRSRQVIPSPCPAAASSVPVVFFFLPRFLGCCWLPACCWLPLLLLLVPLMLLSLLVTLRASLESNSRLPPESHLQLLSDSVSASTKPSRALPLPLRLEAPSSPCCWGLKLPPSLLLLVVCPSCRVSPSRSSPSPPAAAGASAGSVSSSSSASRAVGRVSMGLYTSCMCAGGGRQPSMVFEGNRQQGPLYVGVWVDGGGGVMTHVLRVRHAQSGTMCSRLSWGVQQVPWPLRMLTTRRATAGGCVLLRAASHVCRLQAGRRSLAPGAPPGLT
jgi:hypothetical protein